MEFAEHFYRETLNQEVSVTMAPRSAVGRRRCGPLM